MPIPALDPNTIIIAIILALGFYGLLAGKQRLRILILSVYVGVVLAEQMSSLIAPHLSMLGSDQISWLLLGLPILIFGFVGVVHKKNHAKGALIANLIVGLLTGALIVSSALRLMPTSSLTAINDQSFIAIILQQYHLWILGLLPLVVLVMGMFKGERVGHH